MNIPNVSVTVDIVNIAGVRLGAKGITGTINFDVKAKLEEKERRSQMVIVNFNLFLATKPSVVKFEVEGTATLTGKDAEINKMLEVDPEIKVPYVFQRVYQNAFEAMYLLSTILKSPPPPPNLLLSQRAGMTTENIEVDSKVGEVIKEESVQPRIDESASIERKRAVMERPETPLGDNNAEPKVRETKAEERSEEILEG